MTDITEVKKLIDDAGNAVSQLRQSQEQAVAEFKKHGDVLAETKSKTVKVSRSTALRAWTIGRLR